jgi:hypothetical protein
MRSLKILLEGTPDAPALSDQSKAKRNLESEISALQPMNAFDWGVK